jgi:serine/threonine protein kinase
LLFLFGSFPFFYSFRGFIYRDLKPQNVLLNSDGHVQLVDLGGIMDDHGTWSQKQQNSYKALLPLFSSPNHSHSDLGMISEEGNDSPRDRQESSSSFHSSSSPFHSPSKNRNENDSQKKLNKPKRKQSIMGTIG